MGGAIHFASATPIRIVTAGRHQNVDLCLLAHGLAALGGDDGDNEDRERAARAALGVCRPADRRQREQHHGWGL